MTSSAIEAEAAGQEFVTALFNGEQWRIPTDVDSWPHDLLLNCVAVRDGAVTANPVAVAAVLQALLVEQWPDFTGMGLKRRDLAAASNVFAAAVGIPAKHKIDVAFGAIPRLLYELDTWSDAVEATLSDMGVDYRDRWRFDDGQRRLTLRQIHVRLSYAPYDCALVIARNNGVRPLSDAALVLMDLFEHGVGTGVPHPSRPLPPGEKNKRESEAEKRRKAHEDYRKRHAKGVTAAETARANAQQAQQRKVAHA